MKVFEKWWSNGNKSFSIRNYKREWKKVGNKPRLSFHENGGRRKNGDRCLDVTLIVGYTFFNYTNHNLQEREDKRHEKNSRF